MSDKPRFRKEDIFFGIDYGILEHRVLAQQMLCAPNPMPEDRPDYFRPAGVNESWADRERRTRDSSRLFAAGACVVCGATRFVDKRVIASAVPTDYRVFSQFDGPRYEHIATGTACLARRDRARAEERGMVQVPYDASWEDMLTRAAELSPAEKPIVYNDVFSERWRMVHDEVKAMWVSVKAAALMHRLAVEPGALSTAAAVIANLLGMSVDDYIEATDVKRVLDALMKE